MQFSFSKNNATTPVIFLLDDAKQLSKIDGLEKSQRKNIEEGIAAEQTIIPFFDGKKNGIVVMIKKKDDAHQAAEACRRSGASCQGRIHENKWAAVLLHQYSSFDASAYHFAEGLALANYQFLKYKTDDKKKPNALTQIFFSKESITLTALNRLQIVNDASYKMRTLINEPLSYLTAPQLSEEIKAMGKEAGFKVTVWQKAKIQQEKMGGLLSVNLGSQTPPTFNIMEYKPAKSKNKKPIVLIGKGVVYDTGGLSLKPTPNSMDQMKSDMSGAALVSATMYAIARLELPLHIIALVPATDNRPGEDAYVPGDVITMYSGATVEVLNTDAEGRMILADALHYAKRLKPELVLDFATLTGAASAAVGDAGMVAMGTAEEDAKGQLREAGNRQYERIVELPLWEEYGDMIKSTIADIKNIGGPYGGAITAGKFLQHFTDYPWVHFDIAGVSYTTTPKKYFTHGGTGFGLRMMVDFLSQYHSTA